jgi:uncharacterized membrane protein YcaP (DUF421 family)
MLDSLLQSVFGGDVPQQPLAGHQVAARAVVVYLIGIVIVRWGKSRLISRVTAIDVLLGFILGSLLSRGITGHASITATTISSAAIVTTHFVLTRAALYCPWLETKLKGHDAVVIDRGEICQAAMAASHISHEDLFEQLRLQGVEDVTQVKFARKERSGEISVIKQDR